MTDDLVFYRPASLTEAVEAFAAARVEGREPAYYGGGTELLTLGTGGGGGKPGAAWVDLKGIPECSRCGEEGEELVFGAAASLNAVDGSGLFPCWRPPPRAWPTARCATA